MGANLPDMDAVTYFAGPAMDLAWRRGWTHGVLALIILPALLTGALLLVGRYTKRAPPQATGLVPRQVLFLSSLAILSHPLLDTLNTYGVRWLMPFSGRWFYGDVLFIIDPLVWLMLGAGLYLSWRRRGTAGAGRPARVAIAAVLLYVLGMTLLGVTASRLIASAVERHSGAPVGNVMAGPVPLNLLARNFVAEQDGEYRVGTFHWTARPRVNAAEILVYPRGRPTHPAVAAAVETEAGRRFLSWARFPTYQLERVGRGYIVHIVDLRYARHPGAGFGTISIRSPR